MSNIEFPENVLQAIQPTAKKENKLLIAQGMIPMPPPILIEAMRFLMSDPDTEIQITARQSIQKYPVNIVTNLAQTHKVPETLDLLADIHEKNDSIIEKLLLNSNTSDSTFVKLSTSATEKNSTIIGNNQVRILRTPQIAENLKKNPNMLRSEMDRLLSFLRMNGIVLEGESPELTLHEIESLLALGEDDIPEEFLDDSREDVSETERMSVYQYIQTIGMGKKIKLALKGNKEARALLVKESNKVISSSVIKNPRITDGEILTVCQNRSVNEELIRMICNKQEWVKHYSIQLALASNPRTPFQSALRFVRMLTANDLKKMAKNKNAPGQIQKIAKELFMMRRK